MHGNLRMEQESSSGGNGIKRGFHYDSEGGEGFSGYDIELKQHGSPTAKFMINSSSSWGDAERSLLGMVERNKTNKVFEWIKEFKSKGLILAIFAVVLELVMWIMLKRINTGKIPFDIYYLRSFTNMVISMIWGRIIGVDIIAVENTQRSNVRMLIVTSFLAAGFTFMSYMINDLTIATVLLYTSILFTSVFAFWRFSEKIDRFDAINLVVSIISILLIMNLFEHGEMRITEIVIGICGAMFLGISYVIVKDMDDSINFLSLTFYEWLGMWSIGPLLYFTLGSFLPEFKPSIECLLTTDLQTITLICVTGFLSQTLLNAAYRFDKTTRITGMRYIQIVIALLVDLTVFETVFSVYEVMGCVIILTYNLSLLVIKSEPSR